MAQVMYTPDIGVGSVNAPQQVSTNTPSNASSMWDAGFKTLDATVGNWFRDKYKELGDYSKAKSEADFNTGMVGAILNSDVRDAYSQYLEDVKDYQASHVNVNDFLDSNGTSAKSSGQKNLSSILGSSAYQSSGALQAMYDMFLKTGETAWLEKLIDSFGAIENTESARAYEKNMSDTAFSRLMADIENAGYNPWLALQSSFGQASTGNGSAASISNVSPSQQALSRENNLATVDAKKASIVSSVVTSLLRTLLVALMVS